MTPLAKSQYGTDANSVYVCRAAGLVAFHFSIGAKPEEKIVVRVPERAALKLFTAGADANGKRWPSSSESSFSALGEVPIQPALKLRPKVKNGTRFAALQKGWDLFKADPSRRVQDIAREVGVTRSILSNYFSVKHRDEFRALRKASTPVCACQKSVRKPDHPREVYEAAFNEYLTTKVSIRALAERLGVVGMTLGRRFRKMGRERALARYSERQLVTKPNGKLL